MATHWHIAYGLAGYGPDGAEDYTTCETLSDALETARDYLAEDVSQCWETARALAEDAKRYASLHYPDRALDAYASAWVEVERAEGLEVLRANLDPARRNAPLYASDPAAYAALQADQYASFPVDVSHSSRLYVWECTEDECTEDEEV